MKRNDKKILPADLPLQPQEVLDLFYPSSDWEERYETIVDETGEEYSHQPSIGRGIAAVLRFLKPMFNAHSVLDLGTCLGYSARVLAELVGPDGEVLTIERDPLLANHAEQNLKEDGMGSRVRVLRGDARSLMNQLVGPFDLILLDFEKTLYSEFYDDLIMRLRPGGYLIADDISFLTMNHPSQLNHPRGIADFVNILLADSRLETIFLPLGDGVTISRKQMKS